MSEQDPLEGIAVVGMAGRFPGADDLGELWRNLCGGVESIRFYSREELAAAGVAPALLDDPRYVRAGAPLRDVQHFDADFFDFSAREAELMDPQHRLFLECCWEALENAGYDTRTWPGSIGLFAGMGMSGYLIRNLLSHPDLIQNAGPLQIRILNDNNFLTSLAAYKLDLRGPSVTVQSACSTSLVATCMACQSLLQFQCDMVLAGGVTVVVPHGLGYLALDGVMSPDGHCRAFDAGARGTVEGSGAGVVVLKRLADAVAEGDTIHAVIRGFATNNDGGFKMSFTAPSPEGQSEVIATAQTIAGVPAESITYVETHGTGTPLGDPVEVAALSEVFAAATEQRGFCALGAIKTNIGHLDAAAGVAGLIKAVLAVEHGVLPPSLHFETPNPRIDFAQSPFYVNTECRPWRPGGWPRRAGVSAFAIGGVNAHVILEEPPAPAPSAPAPPWLLLVLSARTETALEAATDRLLGHLRELPAEPATQLADIAYTLEVGRRAFPHRRMLAARDLQDAVEVLERRDPRRLLTGTASAGEPQVAFLFPGLGTEYAGMARGLYRDDAGFRARLDDCAERLEPLLGLDLRDVLFPEEGEEADGETGFDLRALLGRGPRPTSSTEGLLRRTAVSQPAVFAVEYALASRLLDWGIRPQAMVGFSIGEYVAACLAGVLSLDDALRLVAGRARLIDELPGGAMLAVPLGEEAVASWLAEGLSLAAVAGPELTVLAGTEEAVAAAEEGLTASGHVCRRLQTSHAFHSALMEPAVARFLALFEGIELHPPEIPYLSNVTGHWITAGQATDPAYWAEHLRGTVRFADAVSELWREPGRVLVEVGPGQTLSSWALQQASASGGADPVALPTLRHAFERTDDLAFLLQTVGRLWLTGLRLDWPAFWADPPRRRVPLPTYPFERRRYWIEPRTELAVPPAAARPVEAPAAAMAAAPTRRHVRPSLRVPYAPPRDATERRVVEILGELLRVETVGLHDGFFELGGDSLLATHLVARLNQELGAELTLRSIFESPTAAELAVALAARPGEGAGAWGPVARRAPGSTLPLSFAQQRLWFLDQLEPGNPAYNLAAAVLLTGPLDRPAFAASLEEVVARHEALRTTFGLADDSNGEPVQRIAPPAPLPLPGIDLAGLPEEAREAEALRLAAEEVMRPFDVARGPLLRAALLRLDAARHVALLTLHHMVGDGWSIDLLVRELAALYPAFAAGLPSPLPPLPVQYADFVLWQRASLRGAELATQLAFWRGALAGAPAVLDLPSDRPRPARASGRGGVAASALSAERAEALRAVGRQAGATPFMTFLAAFYALLHRLTGEADLVVGTPVANRRRPELEGLIGFFANTLALRAHIPGLPAGEPTFAGLLAVVREAALSAYAHQDLPFERLVEELAPERSLARTPLFQVMFLLHGTPVEEGELAGLTLAPFGSLATAERAAKFDLTLELIEGGPDLAVLLEFRRDLFDAVTAVRLLGHFTALAGALAAAPEARLAELPLLTAAERQQLVGEWSQAETVPRLSGTLHGVFAAQAARTPAATAVIAGTERLSYGELAERVRRLAGRLSQLGMGPERIVGVRLGRTAELVVTLLAVLESGAAYLPLDPAYPAERLRFLLADTGAALVVAERSLAWPEGFTAEIPELYIDEATLGILGTLGTASAPASARVPALVPGTAAEENLAYVIYTSGSTGVPKGVAIPHGSALRLVEWALARYSAAELAGVLFSTSTSFDLSIFEIFVPLSSGGAVIVADDALALNRLPAVSEVTLVNTVPSALAGLLDLGPLPAAVRTVNLAGEPLRGALAERIHGAGVARLWNLYGPSEDTTYSTGTEVAPGIPGTPGTNREPDIGRPLAGSTAFVLDGSLGMLPVGVPGELCLGGEALARGYLHRPELTAERFVPDPFGGFGGLCGSRLYRTGDRARWRSDGALELLGRMDRQVKVRGFRIELGEIEAVLTGHPAVREAAVTAPATPADPSGDRRLVAYVSATEGGGPLDVAALGVYLGSHLPSFMVPSIWVELAALPLTRTGKVDRKALPAPGETATGAAYEAPRTATEEMLAGIWGDLLRRERVGVHDNFFALGGHSLLATQVVSRLRHRLGVELPVRALFEQPTVAGLAVLLADHYEGGGVPVAQAPPIVALPRDAEGGGTFPASFAQRRLWLLDQLEPGSAVYNMPLALLLEGKPIEGESLEGELAEEQLAAVFGELARRHETLRTTFIAGADGPLQVVHPMPSMPSIHPAAAWPFALQTIDLSALGEEERRRELTRRVAEESLRPFDLARGPLLRGTLVRLAARENALLLTLHHVISDGWSMGVLVREVTALYAAAMAGWRGRPLGEALPPLPVQYADFSVWQSRRLSGETLQREIEHWREKLAGVPPFLELPTDRPRPPVQTFGGRSLPLWLEPALMGRLSALALATGTTLFMVLLAGFETLLGIYSGAQDLAVGTPIAGRNRAELEGLIGFFVNSLVLRGDLSGDPSFVDLLGRVREDTLSAYTHQDLPFEKLVEEVRPERSRAHSPIFQVMFALQNAPMGGGSELPGLTMRPMPPTPGSETAAKYDLTLALSEGSGGIGGTLEYNVDLFDAPTMLRMLDHWRALLAGVVADSGARLSALSLLGAVERQQLLREWSDAAPVGGGAAPVHELFAAQAARRPDAVALVCGDQALTYGELARRSSRMARRLAELGVGPGMLVGLCAERSPELVLGVLAILAAGGAYLPLDPAHPMERLAYTLADAGAPILLAEEHLHERLPAGAAGVVGLHALAGGEEVAGEVPLPAVRVDPGDLAYVIYTSGSTGRPKGVEVSHANAARLFAVIRQAFDFGPDDVWTLFHSIAFDFSVWELWGALAFGGRLVVVPGETVRSPEAFYELLRRERVTVLSQTPSAFRQLLWAEESALARGEAMVADLRLVVFGGEALDPASLSPWFERHGEERPLLVNMYGITETTVHTTWRRLRRSDLAQPGSAIGRPLSDLSLHLLDRGGRPVPIGVPGEIYVGGAGVARGYLARPALTAERFVPDPFAVGVGGQRLYRSGDLARWRRDGDLEYLGRIDRQVKVRGFRIELGEIEAALAEHPGVREAAVVAREDRPGDVRLVGYVSLAAGPDPSPQALAAFLAERLPGYMVPAAWVLLDRLPLTANGKVDRAALPAPEEHGEGGAYVAPRSPVEEVLAGIWEEVLELQRVGVEDDFFALGGHSLVAAQVTSRVLKAFSVDLPLRFLFEHPTVAALAAEVERLRGSGAAAAAPPLVRAPRGTEAPLSFRQEWRWLIDQLSPDSIGNRGHNVPLALKLRGAVSVPALAAALAAEVERHESLRTRFVAVGGKPVQRIDPPWRPPLPFVDLGGLPPAAAEREAARLAEAEWTFLFDIARGPLLHSFLLRLEEEVFVLLLTLHHIISDGWSMLVLGRELPALYRAARAGLPSPLPELPIQFRDFAIWQRGWLQGEALERLLGAAVARLAGMPRLDLPLDRPYSAQRYSSSSGLLPFGLDVALTDSLSVLSRRQGASLFMTVLAAFTGLLRRHTGRGDFPVAIISAGRTRAELEPLVGYFTNTLVIRAAAEGDPSFGELLARTRGATLAAYDQQDLPFSFLVEALRAGGSGGPPRFEVLFLLQPQGSEVAAPDAEVAAFPVVGTQAQDFPLVLDLVEAGGGLIGTFSHNQALIDSTTALRWRGHLEALLAGVAADPTWPLTELPLLSAGERHQVTFEWGEAVHVDGGPAPIGIWGELTGAPAAQRVRRLADGTLEVSAPAPAGLAEPAEAKAAPAFVAPAPTAPSEPARSLDSLSAAKRKLLAKRIRGER
ncbi:MAG TPA: amino acid adenylation domain-containing protein [Thermoanaerobaculia bacterium]|jgi:amino acid adenylation domain-containing protein|nr:amino acid adenylation domain-containing protein [Thermoanaerobaculia bacterium]